ncbi:ABC transporter substrate-binding protein [Thermomicrobium sp. 4228-Ro]|uniref:ABC transporter substrate-binding protein n=1 Tax=Thermomicrobium sp. 4228-Ro TaxID=2993937 RepID=UPI0022493FD7|nr:ABC transporter substrate-binding protein [Thermomicrobium sp. 4228-Ro]MCX2726619.1 ABC transporter substrate-binding protein [Thermomicrobium sp. 4228-Ro]
MNRADRIQLVGSRLRRRTFLGVLGGAALSGLLAACGGGGATPTPTSAPPTPTPARATPTPATAPTPAAAATPTAISSPAVATEPIRIGLIHGYTGVFAALAENLTNGIRLHFESIDNTVAGRKVEFVQEDDASNPEQGLTKTKQLVERLRVQLIIGYIHSGVALACRDYLHQSGMPTIIDNAGAAALTRDPQRRSPYIFRVSFANGQYEWPLGPYAVEQLGYKQTVVLAPDYAAGKEKAAAFKQAFLKAGGRVVEEIYPPLDTTDFAPFLQRIQQMQADAVWAFFAGADAVRFVQQYTDFGLKDQFPLIGVGDLVDEAYLDQQGDAALGVVTSLHYSPYIDSPENKTFVDAYRAKYGRIPNQFAYQGYLAGRVAAEALAKVQGRIEDKQAFLKALKDVQFVGPAGPFRFHPETQNVILTVYFRRVERLPDGSLGNVVIGKRENVDDLSF